MVTLLGEIPWVNDKGFMGWSPWPGCIGWVDLQSSAKIVEAKPGQSRGVGIFVYKEVPDGFGDAILATEDPREAKPSGKILDAWESLTGYRPAGDTIVDMLWDHLTNGSDPDGLDACCGLQPKQDLTLELWLGARVASRKFVYGNDPYTAKLKDSLRRQLEMLKAISLDSSNRVPADHYQRVADAMVEQYAGTRDMQKKLELFADLKPTSWDAGDVLKPHATTYTENFNGADNASMSTQLTWTDVTGDWQRLNNRGSKVGGNSVTEYARAESALSSDNHYAQVKLYASGPSNGSGPVARFNASASTFYTAIVYSDLYISAFVAGVQMNLGNSSFSFTSGDVVKIVCNGSTIEGYQNGSLITSVTNSGITGNVLTGILAYFPEAVNSVEFDDFECGDLVVAGAIDGSSAITLSVGTCTLSGSGTLTGSSTLAFSTGTCTLSGTGTLTGSSSAALTTGTCTLTGVGTLTGVSTLAFSTGSCVLVGAGSLTGSSSLAISTGTCTLVGTGLLSGSSAITFGSSTILIGLVPIAGTSALTFSTGTCTLLGAGTLAGSSSLVFGATLTPDGGPSLIVGSSSILLSASATLLGSAQLLGSSTLSTTASATLLGNGLLLGNSTISLAGTATLAGSGLLAGSTAFIISSTALLHDDTARPYQTGRIIIDNNYERLVLDTNTDRLIIDNR